MRAPSKIMVADLIEEANAGKIDPFDIVLKIQTPLGHQKWVRVCGWLAEGNPPKVFGLTYDITYSKEAELRLKSSEHKFSSTFHGSPDLMILMQRDDWIIADINGKIFPMLHYTREELMGSCAKDFTFFVHEHERQYFFTQFYASGSVEMEAVLKRKNGSTMQALLSFNTLEFEDKKHILAVIKDISSRKAAEERFNKAFDLSPDLMLIFRERDLILIECNKNVETLSGYKRNEIIGKSSIDFNLWAISEDRIAYNNQYFGKGGAVFMETEFLRKDGTTFKGNISAKRISLQEEDHMLVVVRDITERKIAEQKILESEANLYAVINNTNLIVWSVDREFRIIKANKPFSEYVKARYKMEVILGDKMIPADASPCRATKEHGYPVTSVY